MVTLEQIEAWSASTRRRCLPSGRSRLAAARRSGLSGPAGAAARCFGQSLHLRQGRVLPAPDDGRGGAARARLRRARAASSGSSKSTAGSAGPGPATLRRRGRHGGLMPQTLESSGHPPAKIRGSIQRDTSRFRGHTPMALSTERKAEIVGNFKRGTERHRFARSPDRAAVRPHQRTRRALQRAQARPLVASRPAEARHAAPQAPRLPQGLRPVPLPGRRRPARPAPLTEE